MLPFCQAMLPKSFLGKPALISPLVAVGRGPCAQEHQRTKLGVFPLRRRKSGVRRLGTLRPAGPQQEFAEQTQGGCACRGHDA